MPKTKKKMPKAKKQTPKTKEPNNNNTAQSSTQNEVIDLTVPINFVAMCRHKIYYPTKDFVKELLGDLAASDVDSTEDPDFIPSEESSDENEDTPEECQKPVPNWGTCPVCNNELSKAEMMMVTPCGHVYCHPCIKQQVRARRKCLKCKKYLTQKMLHPIFIN